MRLFQKKRVSDTFGRLTQPHSKIFWRKKCHITCHVRVMRSVMNRVHQFIGLEGRGSFVDAFTKLWKATVSFVRSVCPSVRMEQLGFHWTGFSWNLVFQYFSKICLENSSFIKIWQESQVCNSNNYDARTHKRQITGTYMKTDVHILSNLTQFFLEWEIFQSCTENENTHFTCSISKIADTHSERVIFIAFPL